MTFSAFRKGVAIAAALLLAAPAHAQLGGIVDRAKREAEREVRETAETAVAKALFPLEEDGANLRRQSPQLDDFVPFAFQDMASLPRTETGGFRLAPGAWQFEAMSYCLKPGSFERAGGSGYRSGELTGALAPYITEILGNSYGRPDIPHADIQRLLWGMIAGVKIGSLNADAQAAARALLSDASYLALDGGVAGWAPPDLTSRARARLPRSVRNALDAHDRMRRAAARPGSSYAELEGIAVLSGEPPKQKDTIPAGRWSWHPDGYHIRYFSDRYKKTTVQIFMGEDFETVRDDLGRISMLRFADGTYVRTHYRESVDPYRWRKFPRIVAFALEAIEYGSPDPAGGEMRTVTFPSDDFIWVTDRIGKRTEAPLVRYAALDNGVRSDAAPIVLAQAGFDWGGARDRAEDVNELRERWRDSTRPVTDEDLDGILDQEHYREGLGTLRDGRAERLDWIGQTHERFIRALARATEIIDTLGEDDSDPTYEPSVEIGFPAGEGYVQRRGTSGRGAL